MMGPWIIGGVRFEEVHADAVHIMTVFLALYT